MQVATFVIAVLSLGGVVMLARGYANASTRRGADELDDRVIDRYKEITSAQEKQIDEMKGQIFDLQNQVSNLTGRNEILESLFRFDKVPPAFLEAIEVSANAHHSRTQALFQEALSENIKIMANAVLDVGRILNEHNDKWDGADRRSTEEG